MVHLHATILSCILKFLFLLSQASRQKGHLTYVQYEQSLCGTELKNGFEKSKHFTTY